MTDVKEKSTRVSGPMVRAILDGKKTQVREVVNLKHVLSPEQKRIGFEQCDDPDMFRCDCPMKGLPRLHVPVRHPEDSHIQWSSCGCGTLYAPWNVGDKLLVKDTWQFYADEDDTREVTDVRVERVQDIGIYDIQSEGLEICGLISGFEIESDYANGDAPDDFVEAAKREFSKIWDSINPKHDWDSNPWVWVGEFKLLKNSEA